MSGPEVGKCMCVRVRVHAQSCLTLYNPVNCSSQAPVSMGFSRQEYWSGVPFPYPGDHPNPGTEPRSPELQADSLPTELQGKSLTTIVCSYLMLATLLLLPIQDVRYYPSFSTFNIQIHQQVHNTF